MITEIVIVMIIITIKKAKFTQQMETIGVLMTELTLVQMPIQLEKVLLQVKVVPRDPMLLLKELKDLDLRLLSNMMDLLKETNGLLIKIVKEDNKMFLTIILIMKLKIAKPTLTQKGMVKLLLVQTNTILVHRPKAMNILVLIVISIMNLTPLEITGPKPKLVINGKTSRTIGITKEKLKLNLKLKLLDMVKLKLRVIMMDQSIMRMETKEVEPRVPINIQIIVLENILLKGVTNINTIK